MDGMADAESGRMQGTPPQGASAAATEGLLSFDADLHVGLVTGRAIGLLGLSRGRRQARGLNELLETSPRLDRDAVAALLAACLAATLPEATAVPELRLAGAPGLRFSIRRASSGSWMMARPPIRLTDQSPEVPSSSIPDKTTPITRGP